MHFWEIICPYSLLLSNFTGTCLPLSLLCFFFFFEPFIIGNIFIETSQPNPELIGAAKSNSTKMAVTGFIGCQAAASDSLEEMATFAVELLNSAQTI